MPTTPRPLGRRVQFDEQSKRFRVGLVLGAQTAPAAFSICWPIGRLMNQADPIPWDRDVWGWDPSSCTGFSRAHACNAAPPFQSIDENAAFHIYRSAQTGYDEWDTTPPGEGSSVIAAAKAAQSFGYIESYWWAFTFEEFVSSLSNVGPGVAGSYWFGDMFNADDRGFIHATGPLAGGHAYCIGGVILELNAAVIYQSWGPITHIKDSSVVALLEKHGLPPSLHPNIQLIDLDDLWELLKSDGEYCISLDRTPVEPLPPDLNDKSGCVRSFLKQMWRPYRG